MPRIKISLPERIDYQTNLKLRVYDMNYGGHMGNDSVLSLAHEARIRFLKQYNLLERDFYGYSLLMADSAVVYKKEAFHGDNINIQLCVSECYNFGFEIVYLFKYLDSGLEIARVKTGLVCYDQSNKKIIKLPVLFRELFG